MFIQSNLHCIQDIHLFHAFPGNQTHYLGIALLFATRMPSIQ